MTSVWLVWSGEYEQRGIAMAITVGAGVLLGMSYYFFTRIVKMVLPKPAKKKEEDNRPPQD